MDINKVKAVLFDWDNTLGRTRPVVVKTMEEVLVEYGLGTWNEVKREKRDPNKSLKENFANFFGDNEKPAYDLYLKKYVENLEAGLEAEDGAIEFVEKLHAREVPLYVVSNKDKLLLEKEVKLLFNSNAFVKILGNGAADENKPHPAPVYKALEGTGLDPKKDEIWFVGDSKQDTDCALASGCVPVLIGKGLFMNDNDLNVKKIRKFDNFSKIAF